MTIEDNLRKTFKTIAKAVEKGAGVDSRFYDEEINTVTNNARSHARGDKINTNLKNMFASSENIEIKIFKRTSWKGILVIDHLSKMIFSICSKNTVDRVMNKINRKNPHYVQILVCTLNSDKSLFPAQLLLTDFGLEDPYKDNYEKDFFEILGTGSAVFKDYHYWLVSYELANYMVTDIYAVLLNKNFNIVNKIPLIEYLKPDFGELTAEVKVTEVKDGHSLVSIKAGLKGTTSSEPDKRIEIYPKAMEGEELN